MHRLIFLIAILFGPAVSHASWFFEPYAGVGSGSYSQNVQAGTGAYSTITTGTDKGTMGAGMTGMRGGFTLWFLLVGADFNLYVGDTPKDQVNNAGNNQMAVGDSIGIMLGVKLAEHLRLWWKPTTNALVEGKYTYTGGGNTFGLGINILKHLSINVEYMQASYNKFAYDGGSSFTLPTTINDGLGDSLPLDVYKQNIVFVSVGIPFGFVHDEGKSSSKN